MTSLESLLCNSCGAPLSVPPAANYINCNHCHTQLHIRRNEGVTFTESIEQLNRTTKAGAMIGGVIVAAFGLIWTVMAFGITASSPFPGTFLFPLFGLLFVAGGIFNAISASHKAHDYQRAHAEYQRQRSTLKSQTPRQRPGSHHE